VFSRPIYKQTYADKRKFIFDVSGCTGLTKEVHNIIKYYVKRSGSPVGATGLPGICVPH
jgi:hypothetical protein